jgi:hypothetical protein
MAITNKQAAARIAKKLLTGLEATVNAMDSKYIASVAEKTRLSEDKAAQVKEYVKGFLTPALSRVENICAKVDQPEEAEA